MDQPEFEAVNPFQRVTHLAGMQDIPPQALAQGVLHQLAAQFSEAAGTAGADLHVHIRRLRVIVADPATLRAAGLHRLLETQPGFRDGWE